VEAGLTLKAGTLLTGRPCIDEFGDQQSAGPAVELVGRGGRGYLFSPPEQGEDLLEPAPLADPAARPASVASLSGSEEDSEDDSEDGESEAEDERGTGSPLLDDVRLFYKEVLDSLVRGYAEKISPENLILEVNSSKFAYNVTVQELNYNLVKAILSVPEQGLDSPLPPLTYVSHLAAVFSTFKPVLTNYIRSEEAELSCLRAMEQFSYRHQGLAAGYTRTLMTLYQTDILSDDGIVAWYHDTSQRSPEAAQVRARVAKLVKWMEQSDEEGGGDESEGSDDEE